MATFRDQIEWVGKRATVPAVFIVTILAYVTTYCYLVGYLSAFNINATFVSINPNTFILSANALLLFFLAAFFWALWVGLSMPQVVEFIPSKRVRQLIKGLIVLCVAYFGYSITRDTYLKDGYLNAGYMYVAAFAGVAIFALFLMIGVKLVGWMLLKPYKAMARALQYKLPFGKFIEFLDKGYGVSKTVEKEVNDDKDLEEPSLGIIAFFAIIAMPFLSYADGAFMASSQTEFAAIQTSDGSKHAIITEHSSAYVTEKYDAKQHTVIHDRQKLFSTQTENSLTTVKIRRMSNR